MLLQSKAQFPHSMMRDIDGFHSIFHHINWRAKRPCDAIGKQHGYVMLSSCHSEKMLWNPSISLITILRSFFRDSLVDNTLTLVLHVIATTTLMLSYKSTYNSQGVQDCDRVCVYVLGPPSQTRAFVVFICSCYPWGVYSKLLVTCPVTSVKLLVLADC